MKVDFRQILLDHISTLHVACSARVSIFDLALFYGAPAGLAVIAVILKFESSPELASLSVTFFGIFAALLLNIQVAMFSVFQRKWKHPSDPRLMEILRLKLEARRKLLMEINANISYLLLISCLALFFFVMIFALHLRTLASSAFAVFIYTHFPMTMIMAIKRSHALFQKEYRDAE